MAVALASRPLIDSLIAQETIGVALIDAEYRYVRINAALAAMNGLPAEEHLGRTVREVLPAETADRAEALLAQVLGGTPIADHEIAVPDAGGVERTIIASYLPVPAGNGIGGVLALIVDSTARLAAEEALASARQRLYLALEGTGTGTFEYDIATDVVTWSDTMGPLYGREPGWSPRTIDEYREIVHLEDREPLELAIARAVEQGTGYEREFRVRHPDGSLHWRLSQVHVLRGGDGAPSVLVGLVHDIEARKRRERRAEFLARAGLALAESLDAASTLQHVVELAVDELADWCSVTVEPRPGEYELLAVAHRDPERIALARELLTRYPPQAGASDGVAAVIGTGRAELVARITDAMLAAGAQDARHLELLRGLGLASLMIVPLVARGRTLGALTFASGPGGRAYSAEDLALAEELGRRAGLALDNSRLYEAVHGAAMTLQRSLLPAGLPAVPGWQAASRYLPGEAGAAVGGDWYDLFELPNGSFALVVGDVMGRGIPAAAGMGRLRSALQANLFDSWDPATALERLDDVVQALRIVPFATALAAVLEPSTGDVRVCSAGHPPPLLRGAETRFLEAPPGPPIGARLTPRRASAPTVQPGESLVLYTDGLVEARESPLDARLALLRDVVHAGPRDESAGALLERTLARMLGPTTPDDVAVVAVRRDG